MLVLSHHPSNRDTSLAVPLSFLPYAQRKEFLKKKKRKHQSKSTSDMAPKIIVANKGAQPPVSPMPDLYLPTSQKLGDNSDGASSTKSHEEEMEELRLKCNQAQQKLEKMEKERDSRKKMLLEMSSIVSSLQGISVKYEKNPVDPNSRENNLENVLRKIKAIDEQLKSSTIEKGSLREERWLQRSTIEAQESQIKSMQDRIALLQNQLQQMDSGRNVKKMGNDERNEVNDEILALKKENEAKYSEIDVLENRLNTLRKSHDTSTDSDTADSSHSSSEVSDDNQLVVYQHTNKSQGIFGTALKRNQRPTHLEAIDEEEECPSASFSSYSASSEESDEKTAESDKDSTTRSSKEEEGISLTLQPSEADVSHCTDEFSSSSSSLKYQAPQSHFSSGYFDDVSVESETTETDETNESATTADEEEQSKQSENSKESAETNNSFEEEYNAAKKTNEELTQENKRLRANNKKVLAAMAEVSSETSTAGVTSKNAGELRQENKDLRNALEEECTKRTLLEDEHSRMSKNYKELKEAYVNLQDEKSNILKKLEPEQVRRSEVPDGRSDVSQSYQQLAEIHESTVMKLADMAEDNDSLQVQVKCLKSEMINVSQADQSELHETRLRYRDLKNEHEDLSVKVQQLCDQYEHLRSKYHAATTGATAITGEVPSKEVQQKYDELLQEYQLCQVKLKEMEETLDSESSSKNDETLKQKHAEALAKVVALEKSNKELTSIKDKYDAAEVKVATLEEELERATQRAESANRKQEQRAEHLRDVIHHYRELEREHEDVSTRLQSLQSLVRSGENNSDRALSQQEETFVPVEGDLTCHSRSSHAKDAALYARLVAYEGRMKDIEKQRDDALNQIETIKVEVAQAKLEANNAKEAKKVRERDLKIVLKYYEELQLKYQEAEARIGVLESKAAEREQSSAPDENTTENGELNNKRGAVEEPAEGKVSNEDGELAKAKKEATNAIEAKKVRERDLKIVLQHYHELEEKYEQAQARIHTLESVPSLARDTIPGNDDLNRCDANDGVDLNAAMNDQKSADNDLADEESTTSTASKFSWVVNRDCPFDESFKKADNNEDGECAEDEMEDEASIESSEVYVSEYQVDESGKSEAPLSDKQEDKPSTDCGDSDTDNAAGNETTHVTAVQDDEKIDCDDSSQKDVKQDAEAERGNGGEEEARKDDLINPALPNDDYQESNKGVLPEEKPNNEEESHCSTTVDGRSTMPQCESSDDQQKLQSRPEEFQQRKLDVGNDDDESIRQLMIEVVTLKRQKDQRHAKDHRDEDSPATHVLASTFFESNETLGSEPSGNFVAASSSASSPAAETHKNEDKIDLRGEIEDNVLDRLQEATDRVVELEEEQKGAEAKMEILERKLSIARRDAELAHTRQESREVNLRDLTAKHKKLEEDYEEVLGYVEQLEDELEQARKEARIREEEAKSVRKCLAGANFHHRKLQEEHELAMQRIVEQERELEDCRLDADFIQDSSKMRRFRNECMADKVRLMKENSEIKIMCNQLIAKLEANKLEPKYQRN